MQELINTQPELEEFQLNYSTMPKEENLSKLPEAIEIEDEENIWEKFSNNEENYNYSR
ncbi:36165_t:CDS:2, partial [Racocetra persica]